MIWRTLVGASHSLYGKDAANWSPENARFKVKKKKYFILKLMEILQKEKTFKNRINGKMKF